MGTPEKQSTVFLQSEADAWYERNRTQIARQDFSADPICRAVLDIEGANLSAQPLSILEVGCGEGRRLAWLAEHAGALVHGLEPSAKAVTAAIDNGVAAVQGTADALPYADATFDVLVFGFCLYLCDPQDLFKIACEADRVLKRDAWLIIHDFHAPSPIRRDYHHKAGLYSHKMDFRKLFDWHPGYSCYEHKVGHHVTRELCDDRQEWVATSLLRKQGLFG